MAGPGVTVEARAGPALCRPGSPSIGRRAVTEAGDRNTTPNGRERDMPRLDLGAVRAAFRTVLHRVDSWTLSTMNSTLSTLNSPAGGPRPPL
jgi:hypothetical protein